MQRIFQIKLSADAVEPDPEAGDADAPLRFQAADGSFYLTEREAALARERGIDFEIVRRIAESELPVRFHLPHDGAVLDPPPMGARLAVLARLLAEDRADGSVHVRFLGRNRSVPPEAFVLDRVGGDRHYVWQVISAEAAEGREELRQRFRALNELFSSDETRVVLALGSGGLKLFAHAAALRLLERTGLGQHVEEVWGSSGGAIAGLVYSHGFSPQALEQTGYDLYSGRYQLALRPSTLQIVTAVLRDALLPAPGALGAGFVDCGRGLQRMLDQYGASGPPQRPFYCPAYNLAECRAEVLTPEPVPPHLRCMMASAGARDAALASSAVPLLFVPHVIRRDGREVPYIDGSMTEDVPLYSVVRKWDLDREAGVETRPRLVLLYVKLTSGLAPWSASSGGQISKVQLLQTVAAAAIETIYQRDVALLRAREDVTLLGLDLGDTGADFFETSAIPSFLRAAKEIFPDQLAALERSLLD